MMTLLHTMGHSFLLGWWIEGMEAKPADQKAQKKAKECFARFIHEIVTCYLEHKAPSSSFGALALSAISSKNASRVLAHHPLLGEVLVVEDYLRNLLTLPNFFSYPPFKHLTGLTITNCALQKLPSSFSRLENLINVNLNYNQLSEKSLKYLPSNLQSLQLTSNLIHSLETLSATRFPHLTFLEVFDNPILCYPPSLAELPQLNHLCLNWRSLQADCLPNLSIAREVFEKQSVVLTLASDCPRQHFFSARAYPTCKDELRHATCRVQDTAFISLFAILAVEVVSHLDNLLTLPLAYKDWLTRFILKNPFLISKLKEFCLAYQACHLSMSQGKGDIETRKHALFSLRNDVGLFITESPPEYQEDYQVLYKVIQSLHEILCPSNFQIISDEFSGITRASGTVQDIETLQIGSRPLGTGGRPIKTTILPGVSLEKSVQFLLQDKKIVVTMSKGNIKNTTVLDLPDTVTTYRDLSQFGYDLGNNIVTSCWSNTITEWDKLIREAFFFFSKLDNNKWL